MDIRAKLQVALDLSTGTLLSEAMAEIDNLRAQIANLEKLQAYQPTTELQHVIQTGRTRGFRLIYNRNSGKEQAAKDLLHELSMMTGIKYDCNDAILYLLMHGVKDICNAETIS